jgi:CDP-glycerol glycerophosphotransferase
VGGSRADGRQPLVSVIIPVHDVAAYLPECLDSVLGQDAPGGLEVIAVDDGSLDGSGALLDERAAGDPRLRVVHLPVPGGPGPARNAGLAAASGAYAWFVDGDDRLAPGALAAVAPGLAAGPDVLLIGWARVYPGPGEPEPGPGAGLLAGIPPGGATLERQPGLITLTMTSWSKLLRREYLAGLGVPFPPGIHEDIPVTCAALLSARSIRGVAAPCYHYRRARRGSFMDTPGRAHLAVFDAWGAVFAMLADRPASPAVEAAVFERAIWHYAAVLQSPGAWPGRGSLVPRAQRRGYFARMHADFAAHRPPGYRPPPGARGVKFRLIERGAYRAYTALEPLNNARVAAAGMLPGRGRPQTAG